MGSQYSAAAHAAVEPVRRVLIGSRSSINVGYVGSDSKYIIMTIDANQPLPGTGPASTWLPAQQRRPLFPFNPDITFLITTTARGIANYNALQTTFEHRLSRGLDFNANYTWSKALTNSRGFFGSGGVAQGTSTSTPVNSRDLIRPARRLPQRRVSLNPT